MRLNRKLRQGLAGFAGGVWHREKTRVLDMNSNKG
jgi:hypothetical protein